MRLLNETHGADKQPGSVRRSQNWIGGSRPGNAAFVPPPPHVLPELLSDFERYLHADDTLPALVRAGLLHVQFETIHPYLDGNGRIGRLLVTLVLEHWNLLNQPLLYLSLYFKRQRAEYYRRLGTQKPAYGVFRVWWIPHMLHRAESTVTRRHDGRKCVAGRVAEALHPRSASARVDFGMDIVCGARVLPYVSSFQGSNRWTDWTQDVALGCPRATPWVLISVAGHWYASSCRNGICNTQAKPRMGDPS